MRLSVDTSGTIWWRTGGGTTDAHVVGVFIFASAEDEKRSCCLCRSLWIHPELDPDAAPLPLTGEDVGDGIIVAWQLNPPPYLPSADQEIFDKEHYLQLVVPLVQEVQLNHARIQQAFESWTSGAIDEDEFLSQQGRHQGRFPGALCSEPPPDARLAVLGHHTKALMGEVRT